MDFDVVILPTFAQVDSWRKQHADGRASGLFAQTVTTFDAWIADLWELHGDGRALVGDVQRELLMDVTLAQRLGEAGTPGLTALAASCMRAAAGVPQFERALDAAREGDAVDGLSARETALLQALADYADALEALGLVELGSACALLACRCDEVFCRPLDVLMPEAAPLTWVQSHFFGSCPQLNVDVELAAGSDGIPRAPEGLQVRFAFPAGRLAQPGLVADVVLAHVGEGDAVVACKDPLALFDSVRDRLAERGLRVCVQARKPFSQTDFGRAFLALHRCLHDDPWDGAALADVLLSPFSGISRGDALEIDKAVRADRVVPREDVLAGMRVRSETFSQLEELASDPDADVLVGVFEHMVQAMAYRSPAWRAEQLAAMGVLRETTAAARRVRAGIGQCASVLERASVAVSAQVAGDGASVVMTTQPIAARMRPGCCRTLVVADLTSEDYPVADRDDAAATLMEKLGMPPGESALSRARREFCALCNVPGQTLVLMRPLGDDGADPTYPSAVLEEFVDAYRADPSATDDIDNAYRLPRDLQVGLVNRGEELLYANGRAARADAVQAVAARIPTPALDDLESDATSDTLPCRDGDEAPYPTSPLIPSRVSPSQIEVYLECPFRWFAMRRLRIEELDEGFGPLERGSFAHAALEAFYRQFRESGHAKVTPANIDIARDLMRCVVDGLSSRQFDEEPKSGRLVYANELERREVMGFCDQLVDFLDFEAEFLPTFRPTYFEFEIGPNQAVEYGGFPLTGKVDRIDVDDEGHAVIVDYKGSVGPEHFIAGKGPAHPGKVQTRIYAQVVRRVLGLDVVGALYVTYGRTPEVSGAYDSRVLDLPHLPGVRAEKCGCGLIEALPDEMPGDFSFADLAFDRMLDATEALAGDAMARMCAGDIAPRPSCKDACAYCPVLACPERSV